jgi:hypothetical protein
MDVRHIVLGLARRACSRDRLALRDPIAASHAKRAEMGERRLRSVRGLDCDRDAVRRHGARERHLAGGRRPDGICAGEGDVDPTVLPARVGVVAEREATQHRPVRRPGPREGSGRADEGDHGRDCRDHEHSRCPIREHHLDRSEAPGSSSMQLTKL